MAFRNHHEAGRTKARRTRVLRTSGVVFVASILSACSAFETQPLDHPNYLAYGPDADPRQQAEPMLRYCEKMIEKGQMELAVGFCRRATQIDPQNVQAHLTLGEIYSSMDLQQPAIAAYNSALAADPKNVDAHYGLSKRLLAVGQSEQAAERLQMALAFDSTDPRLYNALGVIRDMQGQHAQAQIVYQDGLMQDSENMKLQTNLGLSMVHEGRMEEGLKVLESVAQKPSATPQMRQSLAFAYILAGRREDAEAVAILDLPPDQMADRLAYFEQQRDERLRQQLSKANTAETEAAPVEPVDVESIETEPVDISEIVALPWDEENETADETPVAATAGGDPRQPKRSQVASLAPSASATTSPAPQMAQPSVEAKGGTPYGLQMGAHRSEDLAQQRWQELKAGAPALLEGMEARVTRADLGEDKGVFYRLRSAPLASKGEALRLCDALKTKGFDCFLYRAEELAEMHESDDEAMRPVDYRATPATAEGTTIAL